MSADLLSEENEQRLDPEVAASTFPDIDGMDGAGAKYPDIEGVGLDGAAGALDGALDSPAAAPPAPAPAQAPAPPAQDVDEIKEFESSFPALEGEETSAQPVAGSLPPLHSQPAQPTQTMTAPLFSARQDSEPEAEPVRQWREKRDEEIATRDAASEKEKEEVRLKAERAIDSFYKDYNTRKEDKIKKNKEEEEAFMSDRTDGLGKGTTWERICDLLDIDNSQNKQLNRKDLNRFKEVLVGLRKQGERAPGAAGY